MADVTDDPSGEGASGRPVAGAVAPPAGRRRLILTMLRESADPLSIADLAVRLAIHPNTVRFHLDALQLADQVERVAAAPAGPGRPPQVFRARRGMDPAGPRNYRLLAEILAGDLAAAPDPVARATETGRAWGGSLVAGAAPDSDDAAVSRLVGLLDDLGFAPERRPAGDDSQIGLRHCPFLELVETRAQVVCPLHLGLMQGALTAMGARTTVDRLTPFAEADLCLAHLGTS